MEVGDRPMKKVLIAIMIFALSFSIIGCSASKSSTTASDSAAGGNEAPQTTKSRSMQAESSDGKNDEIMNDSNSNNLEAARNSSVSSDLDIAVGNSVVESNSGSFLEGEVQAEGHIVLQESDSSDNEVVIYALTMYGEYAFQNDAFIKISGTGVIPAVITFAYDKDTGYSLRSYSTPNDGSGYVDSIKEMFPKNLQNYILSVPDSDVSNLEAQERKYAKAYLNKIGRSAVIGDYADITFEYPEISTEASDNIFKRYWEYPDWIGTQEKIEDGIRYVYETQWKNYGNDDGMIYFTKYVYGTGEIIKTINVFVEDGVVQSSEEKVTRIIENSDAQVKPN